MMRALFLFILLSTKTLTAQIAFSEDFNGATNYEIPAGWIMYNQDMHWNGGAYSELHIGQRAWGITDYSLYAQSPGNQYAVSTSVYSPTANSNDFLITPAIQISAGNILQWKTRCSVSLVSGDLEILISNSVLIGSFTNVLWSGNVPAGAWTTNQINLSAFAGQTVYIAFRNHSYNIAAACIDDIIIAGPVPDAAIQTAAPTAQYVLTGNTVQFEATLVNGATDTLTSAVVNYSYGVTTISNSLSGLNLLPFESYHYIISVPYSVMMGVNSVQMGITVPGDTFPSNDIVATSVTGIPFMPTHMEAIECSEANWCGWCPRGYVFSDTIKHLFPNSTALIEVHDGIPSNDAMASYVTAYDNGLSALPEMTGWPNMYIERKAGSTDYSKSFDNYYDHINDFAFADLSLTQNFDIISRVSFVTGSAHFAAPLNGDYRLAVVFTEDHVTGTTSGYVQENFYSYLANNVPCIGAGHNWQADTNHIPAAEMEYNDVARTILGTFDGQAGSLPFIIQQDSFYNSSFSYTVPVDFNPFNMHAILLLIDHQTGYILNAAKTDLLTGIIPAESIDEPVMIYPNPTTNSFTISHSSLLNEGGTLEILDIFGHLLFRQNAQSSSLYNISNLSSGIYFVQLKTKEGTAVAKLMKE